MNDEHTRTAASLFKEMGYGKGLTFIQRAIADAARSSDTEMGDYWMAVLRVFEGFKN